MDPFTKVFKKKNMTRINTSSLLTEKLTAAANYEHIRRGRLPNIQRANRYLNAASEAASRCVARVNMVEEYDQAYEAGTLWTLAHSKKELLGMAIRDKQRHDNFMNFYKQILITEITKF